VAVHILNGFSKSLPWPPHRRIGAVCLLAETNDGLLLVDTGLGPHPPRIRQFAAAHPEVRVAAGHMWLDWFAKDK
jgi:hypothetical protein